ncbi:hypothetical protein OJAV_G00201760 [Oryzias javanicus]|uniref:Transmembrane protein 200C n=1 Tax=Oryzias javanicus TaxID=123683 RepID=A0A3S2M379_ORYJA|nr:hypothetical protein OJAV_G00201760 [Oryzias javanicus]
MEKNLSLSLSLSLSLWEESHWVLLQKLRLQSMQQEAMRGGSLGGDSTMRRNMKQIQMKQLKESRKKSQTKRRSEVVVVKGRVRLCSVSGLVAALGVLVLFVGVCMAALGYWPQDGLLFSTASQQGSITGSVPSSSSSPATREAQGGATRTESESDERDEGFNLTESINGTSQRIPQSFLEELLNRLASLRYLYSDWLKVFGPLIMGIGIFLFICANAVLHENRDKKTKIINLQDIYSTVIDVHSSRKPPASGSTHLSSANPLNGLINYAQSESLNVKPRVCPAPLLNKKEGARENPQFLWQPGRRGKVGTTEGGDGGGVFCISQKQLDRPLDSLPSFQHPPRTCWSLPQREMWHSFTIPLHYMDPSSSKRRHSVCLGSAAPGAEQAGWEDRKGERSHSSPTIPQQHFPAKSCSSIIPSQMSYSSLSHLLPLWSSTKAFPCRRKSFPTDCSKLALRQENSCEWSSLQKAYLGSETVIFQSGICKDPTADVM